jgi:hypothetical protein
VSDHLAAVSLFTSERWMECLSQFEGWTSRRSEAKLRNLIQDLKLRPLDEPGDVDSPLLRTQIDEQFLRAMAAARENMTSVVPQQMKRPDSVKPAIIRESGETEVTAESSRPGLPLHPNVRADSWCSYRLCTLNYFANPSSDLYCREILDQVFPRIVRRRGANPRPDHPTHYIPIKHKVRGVIYRASRDLHPTSITTATGGEMVGLPILRFVTRIPVFSQHFQVTAMC